MRIYKISNISTINRVFKIMNRIDYGYIDKDGKIRKEIIEEEFYNKWYLQSPDELLESKIGVCWDQVELERELLKDYSTFTIYIEFENGKSHSFLIFRLDDKVYWFENSYMSYRGIHGPFNRIEDIIKIVIGHIKREEDGNSSLLIVTKYDKPEYGITCQEYMDFCKGGDKISL